MKINFLILIFFLFCKSFALDRSELSVKQKCLTARIGHCQFKEENLHPKTFSGLTIGTTFRSIYTGKNISEYTVGINLSLMNTVYEKFPTAANILLGGDYRYLFKIATKNNLTYYLGPVSRLHYGVSAYFNWDESHLYHANFLSAGIGNQAILQLDKKTINISFDIPLLSIISRPELNRQYKIDDISVGGILKNIARDPQGALPNENFYFQSGVAMNYITGGNKHRLIGYHFFYHYMKADNGNPYQNMKHSLSYTFIF